MIDWVTRKLALTDANIRVLEDNLSRKLPDDFVEWFKYKEGPVNRNIFLDVDGEPCDLDEFYSLEEIVEEVNSLLDSDDLTKKGLIVPFAFDTILSQYCFFYPGENQYPTTVFFKHTDDDLSEIFDGSGIRKNLVISDSFLGFLGKLYIRDNV